MRIKPEKRLVSFLPYIILNRVLSPAPGITGQSPLRKYSLTRAGTCSQGILTLSSVVIYLHCLGTSFLPLLELFTQSKPNLDLLSLGCVPKRLMHLYTWQGCKTEVSRQQKQLPILPHIRVEIQFRINQGTCFYWSSSHTIWETLGWLEFLLSWRLKQSLTLSGSFINTTWMNGWSQELVGQHNFIT